MNFQLCLLLSYNIEILQEMFEDVEHALFQFENLNEELELQNQQVDQRYQLTLYRENKAATLNSLRGNF